MTKIVFIFIISTWILATINKEYIIKYKGIELGVINNVDTYKQGYLKADITSLVLKLIFNRDKFVWHKKGLKFDKDKYQTEEDKYEYIALIKITHDSVKRGNYNIKFNEFVGKCNKKIKTIDCTFKDTLTQEIGHIVFDDNLNMMKYSDSDVTIALNSD